MDNSKPESRQAILSGPLDAYPPAEIARLVESVGVKKTNMPLASTTALSVLAGAFIAFGGMLFTLVMTGNQLDLVVRPQRMIP